MRRLSLVQNSNEQPLRERSANLEGGKNEAGLRAATRGAIMAGDTGFVRHLLLQREAFSGAKLTLIRDLHLAVKLGNEPIVTLLLRHGAGVNAIDSRGRTPLHLACIHGHLSVVIALLEHGADMGIIFTDDNNYEHCALSFAARMGHADVMRALIKQGSDVNKANSRGLTALHYAAVRNQPRSIEVLIENGADIEARVSEAGGGGTALHASAVMRCYDATGALLKHGASVKARNAFGYTTLHGVARQAGRDGALEIADLLFKRGADETAVDQDGHLPLDLIDANRNNNEDDSKTGEKNVERMRKLFKNAPADRAWRRRGFLVLCRAFPGRVRLGRPRDAAHAIEAPAGKEGGSSRIELDRARERGRTTFASELSENNGGQTRSAAEPAPKATEDIFCGVATKTLTLAEDGIFRRIVAFL